MTFTKTAVGYGIETDADENGDYSITITIGIQPSSELIPAFSKDIIVKSNNAQTGYQVDDDRKKAIEDFIAQLNS